MPVSIKKQFQIIFRHLAGVPILGVMLAKHPRPQFFQAPDFGSNFRRKFIQNLLIGISVGIVVHLAAHLHLGTVVKTQNAVLDSMMKLSSDTHDNDPKRPTQVLFDVDEQTYRNPMWGGGEPTVLPLDKIAVLIEKAFDSGARFVLVDFAIDGARDERQDDFISQIHKVLKAYPEGHLLFVRSIRQPLEPSMAKAVRPSALDGLIASHPDNVHAVAPNFLRSSDNVLRHWRLWESACYPLPGRQGEGRWVVIPSPQLAIASIDNARPFQWSLVGAEVPQALPCAVDGATENILDQAQSSRLADWHAGRWVLEVFQTCYAQDTFTEENCSKSAPKPDFQAQKESSLKAKGEALANRILFRQSDLVGQHAAAVRQGKTPPIVLYPEYFDRVPAINLLAETISGPALAALGKLGKPETNTIAVIGASYADSRDVHVTPLGEMPGALVLVNAIDTVQAVGVLQSPDPAIRYTAIVVLLLIMSAVFAWLPVAWATVPMVVFVALTIGPMSFWFLKQGIWLDFGAPIVGIYLFRKIDAYLKWRGGVNTQQRI